VLTGNALDNTLNGDLGADTVDGGAGADTLVGGDGNDSLAGGAGVDSLAGGLGNDTYVVDSTSDVVTENAGEGTADLVQSSATYTLSANVENLTLTGAGNINGTGNTLANVIIGTTGLNVLSGDLGNDTLDGGSGADTLIGGEGNDSLFGGGGTDSMVGGLGNDIYEVNSAADVVLEDSVPGGGSDLVQSSATYTLAANVENLTLTGIGNISGTGNTLDNVITGNAGNNTLSGGAGNDALNGLAGGDNLSGAAGNDTLDGGGDADTLSGGADNDTLIYDSLDASVLGGLGSDTLKISGSGTLLNLGGLAGTTIQDVEVIDLTGTGNNTLTLAASDVLALSSTDTLKVDGNAGDTVNAGSGWTDQGTVVNPGYHTYTQGLATLLVDTDITRNIS
jgi:Ca2+-binding RTX toxin-like protein